MPAPKDPEKLAEYREKMRRIVLERGYGKWMKGRKLPPETVEKMRNAQQEIGRDPEERKRRSERAKAGGFGTWMAGRPMHPAVKEAFDATRHQTYDEKYGDRAEEERHNRRKSNRDRWEGVERKPQRPKHNGDWRYSEWRKAVFVRDGYTCRACGIRGGVLNAHHVLSWAKHPEARYDVDNGRTLHEECHRALHRGEITVS